MLLSVISERALQAVGRGIRYRLGHGGQYPLDKLPTRSGYCDCSGFVAWCLSLDRAPKPSRPWWLETSRIWRDAVGKESVFEQTLGPVVGGLVVFPDRKWLGVTQQGHIAVVVEAGKDWRIVDCSHSNERRVGDAIAERLGQPVFGKRQDAVFCKLKEAR